MRDIDEQKYRKLIEWLRADVLCLAEEQLVMNHIVADSMEELLCEILTGGDGRGNGGSET